MAVAAAAVDTAFDWYVVLLPNHNGNGSAKDASLFFIILLFCLEVVVVLSLFCSLTVVADFPSLSIKRCVASLDEFYMMYSSLFRLI